MRKITFVSGLYHNTNGGITNSNENIISEIRQSIELNPWYKEELVCYADNKEMGKVLLANGCNVHRILDDAPIAIKHNSAHKMKHWMMLNAVKEFGDVVWLDWDTYNLKRIDSFFLNECLKDNNPKFTFIENYWATVNCSVYYLNKNSIDIMEQSFKSVVEIPNDELLWKSVLPNDIIEKDEYWLKDKVINIWDESDFSMVTPNTYFLHLKNFGMLNTYFKNELARH